MNRVAFALSSLLLIGLAISACTPAPTPTSAPAATAAPAQPAQPTQPAPAAAPTTAPAAAAPATGSGARLALVKSRGKLMVRDRIDLTIDEHIQAAAEQEMRGKRGAVVAIDQHFERRLIAGAQGIEQALILGRE